MEEIQGLDPKAGTSGTSEDLAQMAVVVKTPQVMPMRPVLGPELGGLTCSSLELMTTRWAFLVGSLSQLLARASPRKRTSSSGLHAPASWRDSRLCFERLRGEGWGSD